jgi:hypothetical protein
MKRLLFVSVALAVTALFPSSASTADGSQDYAVAGGSVSFECSFGGSGIFGIFTLTVSAHVPAGTPIPSDGSAQPGAGGTVTVSTPKITEKRCPGDAGELVAEVDCVRVDPGSPPGTADITALVTHGSGRYAGSVGSEISTAVYDSGAKNGDLMTHPDFEDVEEPCDFVSAAELEVRGNVVVRSGD